VPEKSLPGLEIAHQLDRGVFKILTQKAKKEVTMTLKRASILGPRALKNIMGMTMALEVKEIEQLDR